MLNGDFNSGIFLEFLTDFSETVIAFIAVNPDYQLPSSILARAEAENIIVVNADNARMRAPVFIFIIYGPCW